MVMRKLVLLLEVNYTTPEPKSHLTTDNPQNICEQVTTTAFQKYGDSLTVVTISAR